ncbi:MAG TPA: hypothetical protein VK281_08535 [Xanthobacteraceae bacterium]|nr:hypothetical protein [Xanthobacteraceae bacterium]
MTNHSLVTADRSTHLKIAAVAVVAAIVVVAVGVHFRTTDGASVTARIDTVIKAGRTVTSESSGNSSVR